MRTLTEAQLEIIMEQVEQVCPDWRNHLLDPEEHPADATWIEIDPRTGHIKISTGWNGDPNAIPRGWRAKERCAQRGIPYPYPD